MSTTNVNNNTAQSVVDQLSSQAASASNPTGTSALGKDAFLQLLVTQLKNQDPLSPQDNTAFVAQLAQFSSLEATQNLSTSVDSIASQYQSSQALQASALVGRSVVVDTGATNVDTSKGLTGTVVLPSSSTATTVKVYDSKGVQVSTVDLGTQPAGNTSFTWDGKSTDGTVQASGNYSFVATATVGGTPGSVKTLLPATVSSVTVGTAGAEMTLNLAGGTSVGLSKVQTVGI
ncbi:flagellar hook assembly protein FlgD [Pseudomonas sp. NA-150]|uniref:flagellar hook assembly protein FlgD n=1 Tax=Pseudomonas sp. NA-150 TaxID=3367525 RepID=UPI0037C781D7